MVKMTKEHTSSKSYVIDNNMQANSIEFLDFFLKNSIKRSLQINFIIKCTFLQTTKPLHTIKSQPMSNNKE